MSRIFIDGFESGGQHDMWDTESHATVISSAGLDMDGDYCLDLNAAAEYLQKDITATDEMYFAFLWRTTSESSGKSLMFLHKDATLLIQIRKNGSSQKVEAYRGSTLVATGTQSLSINTTYLIEVHVKIADAGGAIDVKIDGISDITFSGDTKEGSDTQFNSVLLGYESGCQAYAYYDNFRMDDAAWIGDTNIQVLVPTAGGNSTGWTPSVGSNFSCVDEIPPSDSDYVSINANNVVDSYTMADLGGSIDTINCVQVQARTRSEGTPTPTQLQLVVRSSGTDYFSASKSVPATEKGLYHVWNTDPATSAAWLKAAVDSAEIGVKSIA